MKRIPSFMLVTICAAVFLLGACTPPLAAPPPSASSPTLAAKIVDEWGAAMVRDPAPKAISRAVSGSGRALASSSQIADLKTRALAAVSAAGKIGSDKLDEVLPLIVDGLRAGLGSGYLKTEMVSIMTRTASALVESAGQADRAGNVSAGLQIGGVLADISGEVSAAVLLMPEVSSDASLRAAALSLVAESAVTTLKAIASIDPATATTACAAATGKVLEAARLAGALDAGLVQAVVQSAAAAAPDAAVAIVSSSVAAIGGAQASPLAVTEVVAGVASGAPNLAAAAISNAISSAGGTAPADIAAIVAETPPTAAAAASQVQLTAKATVTLSAAGSTGTSLAYSWIQEQGIPVVITGAATASATVNIEAAGEYVFRLTVKNIGGNKTASATVQVNAAFVADIATQAKLALIRKDFDAARALYGQALTAAPADPEFAFWSSFLDLASLATDANIVNLMRDRIGFVDYPSSMNALFSDGWFNQNWYSPKQVMKVSPNGLYFRGTFTPNPVGGKSWYYFEDSANGLVPGNGTGDFQLSPSGNQYVSRFDYASNSNAAIPSNTELYLQASVANLAYPIRMPRLAPPSWLGSEKGYDSSAPLIPSYALALISSILDRNAQGFNAALDLALAGAYGPAFDAVYARIRQLGDTVSILVPNDLLVAFAPPNAGKQPTDLRIDAREIKLFAAQMLAQKAFVEYLSSYSFNYPVADMVNVFIAPVTPGKAPDLSLVKNPVEAGLLADRGQARRDASKSDFIKALGDFSVAAALFDATYCAKYLPFAPPSPPGVTAPTADSIAADFAKGKAKADAATSAINGTSSVLVKMGEFSPARTDPAGNPIPASPATDLMFNLKPLFDTAFLRPSNLFHVNATNTGFVVYGVPDSFTNGQHVAVTDGSNGVPLPSAWDSSRHVWAFLRLKKAAIDSVVASPGNLVPEYLELGLFPKANSGATGVYEPAGVSIPLIEFLTK